MSTYPMKCHIRAEGGATRVDVYDDIGDGGWFAEGLSAKSFAAQLASVSGPLDIHINSYGGDVGDGIAIGNTIRGYKGHKKTTVDGFAASIASVIAQAGDERVMQPGSMMMIHDALMPCIGNAADHRQAAEKLDKHSDNLANIYATRAGGTAEQWREVMQSERWYTAEEAVAAGLADRIGEGAAELPAGFDLAAFEAVPGRIAARLRTMPTAKPQNAGGGGEDEDEPGACPTCKGKGKIRKGKVTCPDCDGTGKADPDEGEDPEDRAPARVVAVAERTRVLGIESMPLADKALAVHHTATTDASWDGPAAVAAMPADDTVLEYCHAWQDSDAASVPHEEGDDDADDQKQNYKFPHHTGKGKPANLAACRNGLARLSSANIPSGDEAGVKAHLQAHLDDASGGADNRAGMPAWLQDA